MAGKASYLDEELGGAPNRSGYRAALQARAHTTMRQPLYYAGDFKAALGDVRHYPVARPFGYMAPGGFSGLVPVDLQPRIDKPYPWE